MASLKLIENFVKFMFEWRRKDCFKSVETCQTYHSAFRSNFRYAQIVVAELICEEFNFNQLKVARNKNGKKLHGFSFYISMAILKCFLEQKVECKPLFF